MSARDLYKIWQDFKLTYEKIVGTAFKKLEYDKISRYYYHKNTLDKYARHVIY